MENFIKKVSLRQNTTSTKDVRKKGFTLVKDSLYHFKRLSTCSWDDFDISLAEDSYCISETLNIKENKFILNLYPSEGQPCACVCTWDITLSESVPGKTRKCKISHRVRSLEVREFFGRISLIDKEIKIWGTIPDNRKNGEDFELILEKPTHKISNELILEGSLKRGYLKKPDSLERTHEVILVN